MLTERHIEKRRKIGVVCGDMKGNVNCTYTFVAGRATSKLYCKSSHGRCGNNLVIDRVLNTWPQLSLMIKFLSLLCLYSIHCLFSRSRLGAHQHAISGSLWPKLFELHCDLGTSS